MADITTRIPDEDLVDIERKAIETGLKELDAGLSTDLDKVLARAHKIVDHADFRRRISRYLAERKLP